jgi:hypothetical protein
MRTFLIATLAMPALILAGTVQGCGSDADDPGGGGNGDGGQVCQGFGCTGNPDGGGKPGCIGPECSVVDCAGKPTPTTLEGTVFDPAGKVPLYNVVVYVARTKPEPIVPGLADKCDTCGGTLSGSPFAITTTDTKGHFKLENIPAGTNFELVMQIGKWRRIVPIRAVNACEVKQADPAVTRLPRNRGEGDIPRIAVSTGSADALECLLKKVGLDDSEFGINGDARVHLYEGGSTDDGKPPEPDKATSALKSGGTFAKAQTGLWNSFDALKKYDIVLLACEGNEISSTKPEAARKALLEYADKGGRIFTSHYHHYWFSNSLNTAVKGLATWVNDGTCSPPNAPGTGGKCAVEAEPPSTDTVEATLNTTFEKGKAMKEWLGNTGSLTMPGETLKIQEMRHNIGAVKTNLLSWMTVQNPGISGVPKFYPTAHEYVTFNTPVGAADGKVCGRVVFSDLHVGADDKAGPPFPTECKTADLTPQQKALEFMLFDLSSCIQKDDQPPVLPK